MIDEIPGAYKPIDEVMANQSDLVEVVHTLKQVVCVKGEDRVMKIAVMGAGAVGCYYGGMLARHEVTLIGRPQHVDAVQRGGCCSRRRIQERVPMHASTGPTRCAARARAFASSRPIPRAQARTWAPHLDAGALVLSLQNGVDNAARLQALLRQRVAPAVVYVATEMAGAGHVRHHGRGELVVAPEVASEELTAAFAAAGVPLQTSDNVAGALGRS